MNILELIKKLVYDGVSTQEIVDVLIAEGFDPDKSARAFRELEYEATFLHMSKGEGLLKVSDKPCYQPDGYHMPNLQSFKWPLSVEVE